MAETEGVRRYRRLLAETEGEKEETGDCRLRQRGSKMRPETIG